MGNTQTKTTAQALANSPKTFAERDAWMRAVLAADLPHVAIRLAIRIALHLHINTGRCDPTFPTLAAETRIGERTIYRLVSLLDHAGWIAIQRTSGRTNQYVLLDPDRAMAGVTPVTAMAGVDPATPAKTDDHPCHSYGRGTPANKVAGKKRSKRAKRKAEEESDSAPVFASPDSKQESGEQEPFRQFWSAYPKRVAKEAARKAFAAALKGGAEPETLIAGAARYAVERAGQEPKYTKHPATWLNAGCWSDEPAGGAVIDENGNVVAYEQPRQQQSTGRGFPTIAEELDAELAATGREWF